MHLLFTLSSISSWAARHRYALIQPFGSTRTGILTTVVSSARSPIQMYSRSDVTDKVFSCTQRPFINAGRLVIGEIDEMHPYLEALVAVNVKRTPVHISLNATFAFRAAEVHK